MCVCLQYSRTRAAYPPSSPPRRRLIRRDLLAAGIPADAVNDLEGGACSSILQAYDVRRELVNYKKVCLHLYEDVKKIERELQQMMAYFFWQDPDVAADVMAHTAAICETQDPATTAAAASRHSTGDDRRGAASLLDRKRLYIAASRALMRHRGTLRAIHDARDMAKAICMCPRHPDGKRPRKLEELPRSMYVDNACETAMAADPAQGRATGDPAQQRTASSGTSGAHTNKAEQQQIHEHTAACNGDTDAACLEQTQAAESSSGHRPFAPTTTVQTQTLPLPPGHAALRMVLERVKRELEWPEAALAFLETCIIARGGFKALAIVDELRNYNCHLAELPTRVARVLQQYKAATRDAAANYATPRTSAPPSTAAGSELSAAVFRDKHTNLLEGALEACRENAKWVALLAARSEHNPPAPTHSSSTTTTTSGAHQRLFVAGDNVSENHACAFVPKGFALGVIGAASRNAINTVLLPVMRASVDAEGWPPPLGTRRTRARAFSSTTIDSMPPSAATSAAPSLLATAPTAPATSVPPLLPTKAPGPLATAAPAPGVAATPSTLPAAAAVQPRGSRPLPNFVAKAKHRCRRCAGYFDAIWVRLGLCAVCETTERLNGVGQDCCLFKCKLGQSVYCRHSNKCFVCDAPHSCESGCRLSRGDGEVATAMTELLKPALLLLDFDRTLATTKSGASPMPAPGKAQKGAGHSIDLELKAAVAAQPAGTTHIITRNSHKAEIETFLRLNGMSNLAENVHVVPKKKTKGSFIRETFYASEHASTCGVDAGGGSNTGTESTGKEVGDYTSAEATVTKLNGTAPASNGASRTKTCLYIDDDIRELVADPWLRNDPRIHRLLFVRALL